jgi:uncharacterized protein Yka (UPF0111/DUF47 family)
VSAGSRWFLPHRPDVLGLLQAQAGVTLEGLEAFARWSRSGAPEAADEVRELEHRGDTARRALLESLVDSLVTSIEQEDAYELSERIDEVLDRAKDTVRTAQALDWLPDRSAAAMGEHVHEAFLHLCEAIAKLGDRQLHPGDDAELAINRARRIEHDLRDGLGSLPRGGDAWALVSALAVYRSYSTVGESLLRVADRTWYAVLKVL